MAQFRRTVPNQETRLRRWPAGRVNQLKLFLSHMRTATDSSLAAQVVQTGSRTFSQFFPKIVEQDIRTELSYREIRLIFKVPRGLRKFLFYEAQIARFENFNNFDQFQSPEPAFVFTALSPGTRYFIRVRVVSTEGEVGPWSDTFGLTSLRARASSTFDNRTIGAVISDNWKTLASWEHEGVGGRLLYMVNFETRIQQLLSPDFNLWWADQEFRFLENNVQVGHTFKNTNYAVSAIRSGLLPVSGTSTFLEPNIEGTISTGAFLLPGPFTAIRSGTLCQKIHAVAAEPITISLQARKINQHDSDRSWIPSLDPNKTIVNFDSDVNIRLRNFGSFEYVVDA